MILVFLSGAVSGSAKDGQSHDRADKSSASDQNSKEPAPIQDNSFLIEEAYNQEFGVVQHINTFTRSWNTHEWVSTFTQEWPVPGQAHQLGYTLSYLNSGTNPYSSGIGDAAINYCYQLVGNGETRIAIATRITLLLLSGDSRLKRGFGAAGLQTNIPFSRRLQGKNLE